MYFFFNEDPNLRLYLPLDGHLRDFSKNGLNGTIAGTNGTVEPSFEKKLAHARGSKLNYKFNACTSSSPKYINIGTSDLLDISGNQISCIFWVNDYNPTISKYRVGNIFNRSYPSGSPYDQWGFGISSSYYLVFDFASGSNNVGALTTSPIMDGSIPRTYCIAITFNRPWVKFYINGKLIDVKSLDYSITSRSGWQTMIGCAAYGGYGLACQLNDIYLFSRCLSPQEISQYYKWATGAMKKYYIGETVAPANFFPFF